MLVKTLRKVSSNFANKIFQLFFYIHSEKITFFELYLNQLRTQFMIYKWKTRKETFISFSSINFRNSIKSNEQNFFSKSNLFSFCPRKTLNFERAATEKTPLTLPQTLPSRIFEFSYSLVMKVKAKFIKYHENIFSSESRNRLSY